MGRVGTKNPAVAMNESDPQPARTLIEALEGAALRAPERGLDLLDARGRPGERRTWPQVRDAAQRAAASLESLGVQAGEPLPICLGTSWAFLESWAKEDEIFIFVVDETGGSLPVTGTPGEVVFVNDNVVQQFGYTEQDWYDGNIQDTLVHEEDVEMLEEHLATLSSLPFSQRLRKKNQTNPNQGDLYQVRFIYVRFDDVSLRISLAEKI